MKKQQSLVETILKCPDLEVKLKLLGFAIGYPTIQHILRSTPPQLIMVALKEYDAYMRSVYERAIAAEISDLTWERMSLSYAHGGLSIKSVDRSAALSYVSSVANALPEMKLQLKDPNYQGPRELDVALVLINNQLPSADHITREMVLEGKVDQKSIGKKMEEVLYQNHLEKMRGRDKTHLMAISDSHVSAWLHYKPTAREPRMTNEEYRISLLRLLGIPIFTGEFQCPMFKCGAMVDVHGDHSAELCKCGKEFHVRHDDLKLKVADLVRAAGYHVEVEATIKVANKQKNQKEPRPCDLELAYGGPKTDGKILAVDITLKSVKQRGLSELGEEEPGIAAKKAQEMKHKKYDGYLEELGKRNPRKQYKLLCIARETTGRFGGEGLPFLQDLLRTVAQREKKPYCLVAAKFWQMSSYSLHMFNARAIVWRSQVAAVRKQD